VDFSNPYATSSDARVAALLGASERTDFIRRTYLHLGGAVIAFVLLLTVLMSVIPAEAVFRVMGAGGRWTGLLFLGAFMAVSWVARSWAQADKSTPMQYAGLGLYVVAEALIFLPLMTIAMMVDPSIPMNAGVVTGIVFAGLTAFVFMTGADLSFMGRFLFMAGLLAMAALLCGFIFGFTLGLWFTVAMVGLAAGYILYDTSNIMHHYGTNQHVAASLALFASVALLLWYVVQLFISLRDQ
jgi:FtsH-binding integral membrane protein